MANRKFTVGSQKQAGLFDGLKLPTGIQAERRNEVQSESIHKSSLDVQATMQRKKAESGSVHLLSIAKEKILNTGMRAQKTRNMRKCWG